MYDMCVCVCEGGYICACTHVHAEKTGFELGPFQLLVDCSYH